MESFKIHNIARLMTLVLALGLLGAAGCSHDKEIVDDTPPTTGEVEYEDDEVEFEAEKELPEDDSRPTGEMEQETEYGEIEIEVEDDEVEIEGELDYVDPAKMSAAQKKKIEAEADAIAPPDPTKAVLVTGVLVSPADFVGASVFGKAKVTRVISDRGFWVKSGGKKLFAVVREDVPSHEMIDIDAGQTIKFLGVLADGKHWDKIAGELEQDTIDTLKEQPYFINVYWENVEIVSDQAS